MVQIVKNSSLGFHKGAMLCKAAATYATVQETILEQVQNAIDADAKKIGIVLNRKTRRATITDNGNGVSREAFENALGSVGTSVKTLGKLGRFGLGLVSPLGKCETFTFTSCPTGSSSNFIEWTFNSRAIASQKDDIVVPSVERDDLMFVKNAEEGKKRGRISYVPFRTRVSINGYTADKLISRITSAANLVENIFERFGTPMRKNGVTLSVLFVNEDGTRERLENVKPVEFTGKKLDVVKEIEDDSGVTTLNLFLARKTTKGRQGKVQIGEESNDYRMPFSWFARSTSDFLSKDVSDALTSSIFEGEITTSGCTLHANRKGFETNDALVGLCASLEKWYREHGRQHIEEIKGASEEERLQQLGLQSLSTLEEMFKDPRFTEISEILQGFRRGTVGQGHLEPDDDGIVGTQKEPSLTTQSGLEPESDGAGESRKKSAPKEENPDHHPFTVTGPRGQRRTVVNNGSLGLQFSHIAMEGSDELYELDVRCGVLHFNIRHPLWAECEESDRQVLQLQEFIALEALNLLLVPSAWRSEVALSYAESHRALVYLIKRSPAFRGSGFRPKVENTPVS